MKKQIIHTLFATALVCSGIQAQVNYGSYSGTQGSSYSYFGYFAGQDAQSGSYANSAFGNSALRNLTTGDYNVALGNNTLQTNTTGSYNIAVGVQSLYRNSNGEHNVGVGHYSLRENTTDDYNTGLGGFSLNDNTTGHSNTAAGYEALFTNTTGDFNAGFGRGALRSNTIGYNNTALGGEAMYDNTTGYNNTAVGAVALRSNTTGDYNIAMGYQALSENTSGSYNVGIGHQAIDVHQNGTRNTAVGASAMRTLNSGSYNTAQGSNALYYLNSGSHHVALGNNALYRVSGGSGNVAIGSNAGASSFGSYTNAIAIGHNATFSANNQARLGNTNITSIGGAVNFTAVSDGRFKTDVQEDVLGLAFINELRPVSYQLDRKAIAQFDNLPEEAQQDAIASTPHTGFIAQEVEATAQKLGFDRFDGVDAPANEQSRYGLRYASFVVPLVKSVQELSAQNDELRQRIDEQQAQIDALLQLAQQRTTNTDRIEPTEGASLEQNTPNPFSEATSIRMKVPNTAKDAYLLVSNLEGKQLFQQTIQERGIATLTLQANELPAGLYLYTLVVDGQLIDSKKMLITQ